MGHCWPSYGRTHTSCWSRPLSFLNPGRWRSKVPERLQNVYRSHTKFLANLHLEKTFRLLGSDPVASKPDLCLGHLSAHSSRPKVE